MALPEVMELVPEHLRLKMPSKVENTHGGARSGSGRKKMDTGKKQRITFTLADDVIDFLKSRRPASRTIELAVREYANRLEQETKNRPA